MRLILSGVLSSWCFLLLTAAVVGEPTSTAASESPETLAADWVSRFAFHPPAASMEGVCAPSGAALPSFEVVPAGAGRQLVRVSLPFAPGVFPAELGLSVRSGDREADVDLRVLIHHPGRPAFVRRAMVTFVWDFANDRPVRFSVSLKPQPVAPANVTSRPGAFAARIGDLEVKVADGGVEIRRAGQALWRAEPIAPDRVWTVEPTTEVIESGKHFLWVRLLVPDGQWPRILEVRADELGTVAIRAHVQRLVPADGWGWAPDLGWRITGPAATAIRMGDSETPVGEAAEHGFAEGEPTSILAGDLRAGFPDAHLLRRGSVKVTNQGGRSELVYLRCRQDEQVPHQYAAWRTATVVVGPRAAAWTALLEPGHQVRVAAEAFYGVYGSGRALDLSAWRLLEVARQYHIDAMASSPRQGDDFGNIASMPHSGVIGMNRLNHCPPIFEEYFRTGDGRLRDAALNWCGNMHDLSIWWGTTGKTRFGGTRYNNMARHHEQYRKDDAFMWRSESSVDFCTKGCDSFLYAYEETGDPRMANALYWQVEYARDEVHAYHQCRNIGDVKDFVRLYEFTGDRRCLEAGLRLFCELRTKLSTGDLFDQGGQPFTDDVPFIDDDGVGQKYGYAKPYIIGYALSGLPALARYYPDEPKLVEVIRAVAGFLAEAQDPLGGWRYPHPRSSRMILAQAMEHAMYLSRAAEYLESRGESIERFLDAIERVLQQRIGAWARSGAFLCNLGGWERAAGVLKEGQTLHDLYAKPGDRDRSRDYTEGPIGLGDAPPEGVVHFFEALAFYLAHRPAERLFNANEPLQKVLARVPQGEAGYRQLVPSKDYLGYGVEHQLPTFRDALVGRLTFPLAWDPAAGMEFERWRGQARAKVLKCLLAAPPRADFEPVVIGRQDRGTYEARKIVFNVSADCRIPAYLLVPKGKGPFPAVVALHDHGAFFLIGKEKMVRPFDDRPEILEAAEKWVEKSYGGRFVGDALAERGYVVLSADALFWGQRGRKEGVDYNMQQALASNLLQMGMTWVGVNTWDDMRAAEFVASLPEVDPSRIGAVGLSMGCHRTWMLHAVSDRIAAAVAVCWMGTTEALMSPGNNQVKGHSAYSMLVPDLRNWLDYADVAAIACPKPLMVYDGGEKDKLFPVAGVDAAYGRMRRVWESRGVSERLVTKRWDYGHVFNLEMQEEAFAWLDRWLKKPAGR